MSWFGKGRDTKASNPNATTKTPEQLKSSNAREQFNAGLKHQERIQREQQDRLRNGKR